MNGHKKLLISFLVFLCSIAIIAITLVIYNENKREFTYLEKGQLGVIVFGTDLSTDSNSPILSCKMVGEVVNLGTATTDIINIVGNSGVIAQGCGGCIGTILRPAERCFIRARLSLNENKEVFGTLNILESTYRTNLSLVVGGHFSGFVE